MELKRLLAFFALSFAIIVLWMRVAPLLVPPPAGQNQQAENAAPQHEEVKQPQDVPQIAAGSNDEPDDKVEPEQKPDAAENPIGEPNPLDRPHDQIVLGSPDPNTGYFVEVGTTTTGAAVEFVNLNDDRYKQLDNPQLPLAVVQTVQKGNETLRTLQTSVNFIDDQLKALGTRLIDVEWEIVEKQVDSQWRGVFSSVTYRFVSPDGELEVRKRYSLKKVPLPSDENGMRKVRDTDVSGYQLRMDLTIRNLSDQPQQVSYTLQGPVGLPLENTEHTSVFREVEVGFLNESEDEKDQPRDRRTIEDKTISAKTISDDDADNELEEWKRSFRYIGVDVQYFAALLLPVDDQLKLKIPYIEAAQPMLVTEGVKDKNHSDVSVQLTSKVVPLPPRGEFTHSYDLFVGPKRDALLHLLGADEIIGYTWFPFGASITALISKSLTSLLKFMHDTAGIPYGIAIIFLTIMVRGCMFPISRKQAASAKKMKELQPKIAELKKKYANEKEKFAKAQMELFSKNNYNPFAGCLPIFLQMPIFIGLFQALRNAVDLRMTPFPLTWIKNLAAPDALFKMPFALPFLGQDFNLLPLVTVGLFLVQQKLFMPPPVDEQQAMQHKMMNYMMVFMGFMFYHMPAGLCVYFIASSLWGISERKMLDYGKAGAGEKKSEPDEAATAAPAAAKKIEPKNGNGKDGKGWLQRLLEAADSARANQTQSRENGGGNKSAEAKRGSRKKKKKSRR